MNHNNMEHAFEQKRQEPEEDHIPIDVIFEDEKISPETQKAIEYIDGMRREMAELQFSENARDHEKIEYLKEQLTRFDELGEIKEVIL